MAVRDEAPEHSARREALVQMEKRIQELDTLDLDCAQLAKNNIQLLPMSLDDDTTLNPHFFESYQDPLPEPEDVTVNKFSRFDEMPEGLNRPRDCVHGVWYYFSSYTEHCSITYGDSSQIPWNFQAFGDWPYNKIDQNTDTRFGFFEVHTVNGEGYPHTKCVMYNNLVAKDNQLLRGELLVILRLMWAQFSWTRLAKHMVAPIILFSIAGPQHARVIEAYFNGQQLVVRSTKIYDFTCLNAAGFKTFAKLYFGRPRGNTIKA